MSIGDIRIQKGLCLLEVKEAEEAVTSLERQVNEIAKQLSTLATQLVQRAKDEIALLPPEYRDTSSEAYSLLERLLAAKQTLATANTKKRQLGL